MIKTVVDPTMDTTVSKVVQIDIASSQIVNTFSNDTNPLYNFNFDSFYQETNNDRGNFNSGICSNNVYVAVCNNFNNFNNTITLMDASSGAFVSNFTLLNTYVDEVTINSQYLFVKGNDSILNKISINIIYPITSGTVIRTIITPFQHIEGESGCMLINGKNLWNGYGPFETSENIGTYSMTLITLMVPCFKEDTKILTDCGYLPIQYLKKGDLVKTVKHGFQPIWGIGKRDIHHRGSQEREQNQLYVCSQDQYPEIFEDLVITGCHSILVPYFKDEAQWLETEKVLGKFYTTDDYKRLPACVDERAKVYDKPGNYTVYHIALEHPDYYRNYGIYANGLLVETCSKRYLSECSGMELL
jgi:hypothetical protein